MAVTSRFADADVVDVEVADVNDSDDISFTLSLSVVVLFFDIHQSVIRDTLKDQRATDHRQKTTSISFMLPIRVLYHQRVKQTV